jgi:KDO2-lipid IV(A) lauroyltransferase
LKNKPYRYYIYLLLRLAIGVVRLIPRPLALAFARFVGWAAFLLVSRQRNQVITNLEVAFRSEKSETEIRHIARDVFQNLAMTLADTVLMKRLNRGNVQDWVEMNGCLERSRELLADGKGLIFVSGHLGNWELIGPIFRLFDFPGCVVGRRIYYEKYNELIVNTRLEKGVTTVYQDESPRKLLRVLQGDGVVGIVADQDVEKLEGVFVDYFGVPSYTPVAPVRLAQLSGAPILVGAMVREAGRYRIVYTQEPIRVPRDADDRTLVRLTEQWSKALERLIRQYPEQWAWMHDRWRTKPAQSSELRAQSQNMQSGPQPSALSSQLSLIC